MTVAASIAVLIACTAVVILTVYLAIVAVKLHRLTDSLQQQIDQQVTPCLVESRELIAKFNHIGSHIVGTLDSISHAVGLLEAGLGKANPVSFGRAFALRGARAAAHWLAGLNRGKDKGSEQTPEGK